MKRILVLACLLFQTTAYAADASVDALLVQTNQSLTAYSQVQDYVSVFEKEEMDDGKLSGPEKIYLRFEKPFKIFMHWLNTGKKGLQVLYERGRHDGKLVIHKPGLLLGLMPVVFLEQSSPLVREGSEAYDIEDAGIGTFLTDLAEQTATAAKQGALEVKANGRVVRNGIEGEEFDIYFKNTTSESEVMAYHVNVIFDANTHLPVYQELYDWDNQLMGRYVYKELRLNVGEEPTFKQNIHRTLYNIYNSK